MSLRAEYSWDCRHITGEGFTVFLRWKGKEVSKEVLNLEGVDENDFPSLYDRALNRLLSAHMEKVTCSLGLGSRENVTDEEAAEHDRLAHKADHDNQCERDLED